MSDLKKVISIDLSDNTKQGFEGIEQTFKDVDNSIKKAESTSGNLRLELKQLQKDLLSGKFTGEEFTKATQRAGELKDSIGDLNSRIKTLASDSRNLDTLVSAAGAMASGFAIAEGAAGLLGDENKDLQQSILKVQSSMAILQGVTALTNELQRDSTLIVGLQTLGQKAYNLVLDESTGKLNYFKLALVGTGIGIFIILLGELVANWDSVSNAISGTTNEMKLLNSVSEDVSSNLEDVYNDLYTVKSAFDQARDGAISKKDALKVYNDTLGDTLGKAKTLEEAEKLYADKTQDYIKASMLRAQAQALIAKAAAESVKVATGESFKLDIYDQIEVGFKQAFLGAQAGAEITAKTVIKNNNKVKDNVQTLLDLAAKAQKEADDLSKKSKLDFTPDEPKRDDEVAKEKEKADKIEKDRVTKFEKEKADTIANGDAIQASLNAIAQKRLDKEAENKAKADAIQQGLLEDGESPLDKLQRQYDEERAILEAAHQNTLLLDAKFVTDKKALEDQDTLNKQENAAAQEEIEAKKAAAREQWLAAGANTLNQASELLGRSTDAGKAAAIAAATIETYQSAVSSYNSLSGIPVVGPALGAVAAGVAVASGIANVKKILSVKTPKGGGGGGVPGGGSPVATPASPQAQFNIVGQSSNNQLAQTIAGAQQQPVQAFVVAGEVSTQQALDRNKIQNSTFL